jgi:hypothetical protein
MLKDPQRKHNAQLLLSVYSYLYRIAGVPYYREEGSFLYWHYETLKEWLLNDAQEIDAAVYIREFREAEWIGNYMLRKMKSSHNLRIFNERISRFKISSEFDNQCYWLAEEVLMLYLEYPKEGIFRNTDWYRQNQEEEYEGCNDSFGMEKYLSFYANDEGVLYESLIDSVNNEANECYEVDEPCIYKCFNGSPITGDGLDFESRLFSLIEKLCSLFFNYKKQIHD